MLVNKSSIQASFHRLSLEGNKPNSYEGTVELVVSPRLTWHTAWYLLDTSKPVRSIIYLGAQ